MTATVPFLLFSVKGHIRSTLQRGADPSLWTGSLQPPKGSRGPSTAPGNEGSRSPRTTPGCPRGFPARSSRPGRLKHVVVDAEDPPPWGRCARHARPRRGWGAGILGVRRPPPRSAGGRVFPRRRSPRGCSVTEAPPGGAPAGAVRAPTPRPGAYLLLRRLLSTQSTSSR